MVSHYEVLSPWAEADPVPVRGISLRLPELTDQTIGLFVNFKKVAAAMQTLVEERLKARFPGLKFSRFLFTEQLEVAETEDQPGFEAWVKTVDAVVSAVGD
ncbi:MAG: hypothetical protein HY675_24205 [Chloroflexi bacterium]|nr:hypothetical protein [Chloroflexota bacterium]